MADDIRALNVLKHIYEGILCFINVEHFQVSFNAVKHAVDDNKTQVIQKKMTDLNDDEIKLLTIVNPLLARQK